MAKPRRAWVTVEYDGKDITEEISASLLNLTFIDKSADEADEVTITLHDREGHWHKDWYPKVKIKAKESGENGK